MSSSILLSSQTFLQWCRKSCFLLMSILLCVVIWIPVSRGENPSPLPERESLSPNNNNNNNILPIAGYLPDYRSVNLNQTVPFLSDLILFSLEVHSRGMVGGCCLRKDHYERARIAKRSKNPNLNLWVTVGGQGRANGWQSVCQDATKRTRFIESMIRLCSREGIQGIDLDWFSSIRTLQDRLDFLEFLTIASPLWHEQGIRLSIPLHVGQVLPEWAYALVDRIHLMVYDSSPQSMTTPAGKRHSIEQGRIGHAKKGVDYLIQSSCPPHKIWMGIPFFGSRLDAPGVTKTLHEAVEESGTKETSLENLEPLLAGFQFDSHGVVRAKWTMVQERGLGGVFIWELGQDGPSGMFLEGIVNVGQATAVSSDSKEEL